jgi:poly-gamma-glutamate system protein
MLLAVLGVGLLAISEATKHMYPQPRLNEKLAASARTLRCFEAIRSARVGTPETLDRENDPESSGLIGQEFTLTTTDRGVLEAKLTSVNPNFAAVFVQYFHDLGLKPGDPVAIALTGSFPALNIAMVAAAEEMRLKPLVITSVGASMWGANDPKFTYLDMEKLLVERGLLTTRSLAASIGGSNDRGRSLSPAGRELIRKAIERNGIPLIAEPTIEKSVARRVGIFDEAAGSRGVRAFVNVGGGASSIGSQASATMIPTGINTSLKPYNWAQRGVLHHYARKRVPFIHVLNIETIARAHGFPLSPEALAPVGEGEIFYKRAYDLRIVAPALAIYLILCFGVLRARQRAAKAARDVSVSVVAPVPQAAGERSGG